MTAPDDLDEIITAYLGREGPLLPLLHAVQARFGCITPESQIRIAAALNLSQAEVYGVVSFYHDFMETKDSRPAIALCRAEACQARGVEAVAAAALAACADRVRLETVYCLGLCSVGPAARVGDTLYARLDAVNIRNLVSTL